MPGIYPQRTDTVTGPTYRPRPGDRTAVRHLTASGWSAALISDEDLVKAVDAETRGHDYDEVILATSGHDGSWLARTLHLDPIHHLEHRWGKKLTVFTPDPVT